MDDYFGPDDELFEDVPVFDIGMSWERKGYCLLTNLHKSKKFLILRAAEMTPGFKRVIYLEDAYTLNGEKLEDYIAVKTRLPGQDHSALWSTYKALKSRSRVNKIRLALTKLKRGDTS